MPKHSAMEYALYLLSRRSRSTAEIKRKLLEKEYPAEDIEATITRLHKIGLLDDQKFAANYAGDKVRIYRRGRHRIGMELMLKGVSKEIIA